jgi:endoglucanase
VAYIAIDYLLGRNGTGFSLISGFGDVTPVKPHHRISDADGISAPIPGMLAGGPQPGQQDNCSYPSNTSAKSYSDTWCSYSTNEVTINWNAPLAYVTNALKFYQNQGIALSVIENPISSNLIQLYPNPVETELVILHQDKKMEGVVVYDATGKQVYKMNGLSNKYRIDFTNFKTGFYIVKIKTQKEIITKKIIKK